MNDYYYLDYTIESSEIKEWFNADICVAMHKDYYTDVTPSYVEISYAITFFTKKSDGMGGTIEDHLSQIVGTECMTELADKCKISWEEIPNIIQHLFEEHAP